MNEPIGNLGIMQWQLNLLALIDPLGKVSKDKWLFVHRPQLLPGKNKSDYMIYVFERKYLLHYLMHCLTLFITGKLDEVTNIFSVQNGLMSVAFKSNANHCFKHFDIMKTSKKGFRSMMNRCLPILFLSDKRYIVKGTGLNSCSLDMLPDANVLFFSNESGKLLLADSGTLCHGEGRLAVTTANTDYLPVLEKEFETISALHTEKGLVPLVFHRISTGSHTVFIEEYLKGTNLRDVLRDGSFAASGSSVVNLLEKMEDWYTEFHSQFAGDKLPASQIYRFILEIFCEHHFEQAETSKLVGDMRRSLADLDSNGVCFTPVVAHNDLWPGNFISCQRGIVAIDWERAASGRSGLFDFFWMLISAYLEYDVGRYGEQNYSRAFRRFVENADDVSEHVHRRLRFRLRLQGLYDEHFELFLRLFLLEWSLQGQIALGRQTDMDKLAFGELIHNLELG